MDIAGYEVTEFEALPGNGLKAVCDGENLYGGNASFISKCASISKKMADRAEQLSAMGKTPLFFAKTLIIKHALFWHGFCYTHNKKEQS
jgi:cation transport ATPase